MKTSRSVWMPQTLKAVVETLAGEIRLSVEQNSLLIQSASNRTTLRIVDEPIPVIGEESIQHIATFSGNIFRSLARALPFASTDDTRAVLQVLHLTLDAETVIAQTADGYSAGHVRESIEGPAEQTSVSLPLSFARLLSTLVEDRDTVRIGTSGPNRYIFQITNSDDSKDLTLATVTSRRELPIRADHDPDRRGAEQYNRSSQCAADQPDAIHPHGECDGYTEHIHQSGERCGEDRLLRDRDGTGAQYSGRHSQRGGCKRVVVRCLS